MDVNDPAQSETSAIEAVRASIRRLPDRLPGRETIDIALGALYASHDLAQRAGMSPHDAIEWQRSAADLMERQLLEKAR